jgi:hypothetical protein
LPQAKIARTLFNLILTCKFQHQLCFTYLSCILSDIAEFCDAVCKENAKTLFSLRLCLQCFHINPIPRVPIASSLAITDFDNAVLQRNVKTIFNLMLCLQFFHVNPIPHVSFASSFDITDIDNVVPQENVKTIFNLMLCQLLGWQKILPLVVHVDNPRETPVCCMIKLANPRLATYALLLDGARLARLPGLWRFQVMHITAVVI